MRYLIGTSLRFRFLVVGAAAALVFFGAQTDMVTVNVSRALTRRWSASTYGGYARNSNLAASSVSASLFENWYANADLGRQLGRQHRA